MEQANSPFTSCATSPTNLSQYLMCTLFKIFLMEICKASGPSFKILKIKGHGAKLAYYLFVIGWYSSNQVIWYTWGKKWKKTNKLLKSGQAAQLILIKSFQANSSHQAPLTEGRTWSGTKVIPWLLRSREQAETCTNQSHASRVWNPEPQNHSYAPQCVCSVTCASADKVLRSTLAEPLSRSSKPGNGWVPLATVSLLMRWTLLMSTAMWPQKVCKHDRHIWW